MSLENPSIGARTYTLDKVDESLDSENYENWAYPLLQPSEPQKEVAEESTAPSEPQEEAEEELRESTEQEILAPQSLSASLNKTQTDWIR